MEKTLSKGTFCELSDYEMTKVDGGIDWWGAVCSTAIGSAYGFAIGGPVGAVVGAGVGLIYTGMWG